MGVIQNWYLMMGELVSALDFFKGGEEVDPKLSCVCHCCFCVSIPNSQNKP